MLPDRFRKSKVFAGVLVMTVLAGTQPVAVADCGQILIVSRIRVRVRVVPQYLPPPPPSIPNFNNNNNAIVNNNVNVNNNNNNNSSSGSNISSYPPPDEWVNETGVRAGKSFSEPNQYAVVAWNGDEEILWISTRQKSNVPGAGAALSILPLPGRPISVKRGKDGLFQKASNLLTAKLTAAGGRAPVLTAQIGAHNIFVLQGKSAENIESQIQDYISKKFGGKATGLIAENTRKIIKDYISRKFEYFAFDLITSSKAEEIKVPIQYRFKSSYCYYPMVVSKIGGTGKTQVQAVAFTRGGLRQRQSSALPFDSVKSSQAAKFSDAELQSLSPEISKLFDGQGATGRSWFAQGDMDSFQGDIAWK